MKKKPKSHLKGAGSEGAWDHSWELSELHLIHAAAQALSKNQTAVRTMTVSLPIPGAEDRASFPSTLAMRRDVTDNFGYRVPRLLEGPVAPKAKEVVGAGRPRTLQPAYATIVPGEPDLDAGVSGWEQPEDTSLFPSRGKRMSHLLATINRIEGEAGKGAGAKVNTRKPESSRLQDIGGGVVERVGADGVSVMTRDTLTASPAISRALQRMIEAGFLAEARAVGEAAMEPIAREYEAMFRGEHTHVKISTVSTHSKAGHYHYDFWGHSTFLQQVEVGASGKTEPARRWDGRAGCHHGPGPGVAFWFRHFDILGDLEQLAETEPAAAEGARYTRMVCDQTMYSCKKRSAEAHAKAVKAKAKVEAAGGVYEKWVRPADDYARDVRINRAVDRILAEEINKLDLEVDFVAMGRAEYRQHLIDAYANGNTGLKMDTVAQLETAAGVAARVEARVRDEREAADATLQAAVAEREKAEQIWAETLAMKSALPMTPMEKKAAVLDALEEALLAEVTAKRLQADSMADRQDAKTALQIIMETARGEDPGPGAAAFFAPKVAETLLAAMATKAEALDLLDGALLAERDTKRLLKEARDERRDAVTANAEALAAAKLATNQLADVKTREAVLAAKEGKIDQLTLEAKADRQNASAVYTEATAAAKQGIANLKTREDSLTGRENNLNELTRKAGLWDKAEAMIKRFVALLGPGELEAVAAGDTKDTPIAEVGTVKQVLSRLAKLAGMIKTTEKTKDADPEI